MREQPGVYRALVRHFFNRFFDTEWIGKGGDLRDSAVTAATLLGAISVVVAAHTVTRHWFMKPGTPAAIRSAMEWADREFIISLSMTVVAVVAVLCAGSPCFRTGATV